MAPHCSKNKVDRASELDEKALTKLLFPQWIAHEELIDRLKRVQLKRHQVFESGPKSAQKIIHKLGVTRVLLQDIENFDYGQNDRVECIILAHWRTNNLIETICSGEGDRSVPISDVEDDEIGGVYLNNKEDNRHAEADNEWKDVSRVVETDLIQELIQRCQEGSPAQRTSIEHPEYSTSDLPGLEKDLDVLTSKLKLEFVIYVTLHDQMKEFASLGHLQKEETEKWTKQTGIGQVLVAIHQDLQIDKEEVKSYIDATIRDELHGFKQQNTSEIIIEKSNLASVKETKRQLRFDEAVNLWLCGCEKRARRCHRYWTKNKVDGPRRIWGKNHNILGTTTIRSFAPLDVPLTPPSTID